VGAQRACPSNVLWYCVIEGKQRRIAYKKMVGADEITATEVSQDELEVLKLKDGDVHL
jgi:hypothetical protein